MYTFDVLVFTRCGDVVRLDFTHIADISSRDADMLKVWDPNIAEYLYFDDFKRFHIFKINDQKIKISVFYSVSGVDYEVVHYIKN